MNIVHIAPNAPYNEGWGYQENILPRYQKKMGHEVTLITTDMAHENGTLVHVECDDWISKDGFRVIRLKTESLPGKLRIFYSHLSGIYKVLCDLKPDFVFFHGMVSATIFDVVRYKKKVSSKLVIVQDNHLDYQIGTLHRSDIKNTFFRNELRFYHKITSRYIDRIYGVTPWRRQYAEEVFGASSEKTDVLIMGADDDAIKFNERCDVRRKMREKYGISNQDFLVVSGGKIDKKKNIDLLMEAVGQCPGVKLILFGNVDKGLEGHFNELLGNSNNITFVGWLPAKQVYDYFFAADLIFFPGQHSVLWEQACASKVPCVFAKWDGMEHVNNGGNSDFLAHISVDSIIEKIEELHYTPKYFEMKNVAESDATDIYLYSNIAAKSLECAKGIVEC